MSEKNSKPDDTDAPPEKPVRYWPVYLGHRNADGPLKNDTPLSPAIQHLSALFMLLLTAGAFVLFLISLGFGEWFIPVGLIAAHLPSGLAFHAYTRRSRSPDARPHRALPYYRDRSGFFALPKTQNYSVGIQLELNDRIESLAVSDAVEWNQFDSYQFLGRDGDTLVVRLDPIATDMKSQIRPTPPGKWERLLEYFLWILPTAGVATLFAVSLYSHGWHADTLTALAVLLFHITFIAIWFCESARTVPSWWTHPKGDGSTYLLFDQRAISEEDAMALLRRHLPEKRA